MAKPALGRGLGALLGGVPSSLKNPPALASPALGGQDQLVAEPRERVHFLALDQIRPCPLQPRKDFPGESLQELAQSIKAQGIIQPLMVRPRQGHYELIAGERRWRAAQLAGLKEVPAILRDVDDRSMLELALIENLQRENLNPIEEAQGYAELVGNFGIRQEDVAVKVGKSRAVVANALRLLKLPEEAQASVRDGNLSVGHAKVLLGLEIPEQQRLAVERVLKNRLSVRQTEEMVDHLRQQQASVSTTPSASPGSGKASVERSAHVVDLENRLRERFGTKVQLRYRQGKGSLEIRFFNDADLERILQIVGLPTED
jgi:ParB family transcriptional regulator, chromosome partitioning protein